MADLPSVSAPALERISQLLPRKHAKLANDCRSLAASLRGRQMSAPAELSVAETLRSAVASTHSSRIADVSIDCAQRLVALGLITGSVWAQGVGYLAERSIDEGSTSSSSYNSSGSNALPSLKPGSSRKQAAAASSSNTEEDKQEDDGSGLNRSSPASSEASPSHTRSHSAEEAQEQEHAEDVPERYSEHGECAQEIEVEDSGTETNRSSSFSQHELENHAEPSATKQRTSGHAYRDDDEHAREEGHAAAAIIDCVCEATQINEETLELPIMRCLLSAVASPKIHIHDRALLRVVRAVYNIYLTSRSETNQTAARASLTQMLTAVFHRMELASSDAPVPALIVADIMRSQNAAAEGTSSISYVQQFLNRVVQDLGSAFISSSSAAIDHRSMRDIDHAEDDYTGALGNARRSTGSGNGSQPSGKQAHASGESAYEDDPQLEQLKNDVFVVFRALCLQARRDTKGDSVGTKRTLLALQLINVLLENAGSRFQHSIMFIRMMKDHLTEPLVKNSKSSNAAAFRLSCSIFLTLISRFRSSMKAEIGIFYPLICLSPLENDHAMPLPSLSQRQVILNAIHRQCNDGQCLIDLFVNFDCDMSSSNLFERTISTLVQTARGGETLSGDDGLQIRLSALHALVRALHALSAWVTQQANNEQHEDSSLRSDADELSNTLEPEQQKANKQEWQHGIDLFNEKPRHGIEYLQKAGKLGEHPRDIVEFFKSAPGLSKQAIGNYIGENAERNLAVMHEYIDSIDFQGLVIDEAIRKLMSGFRVPGEAQKIDRILEKFAERYCQQNPDTFRSADTAYVLSYSVVMLNTDAHNPQVKTKMTLQDFLKNTHRVDNGEPLPNDFLTGIYNRITANEIKMRADDDESLEKSTSGQTQSSTEHNRSNRLGLDVFIQLFPGKQQRDHGPNTQAVLEAVRAKQQNSKGDFFTATDPATVRPVMEVSWAPVLAVLSQLFDEFTLHLDGSSLPEHSAVAQTHLHAVDAPIACLEGFKYAVRITARSQQDTLRDAFVTSLAKLTLLHSPSAMTAKHALAMEQLLKTAREEGDYLQGSWKHVLSSISRHQHLYELVQGHDDSAAFGQTATLRKRDSSEYHPETSSRNAQVIERSTSDDASPSSYEQHERTEPQRIRSLARKQQGHQEGTWQFKMPAFPRGAASQAPRAPGTSRASHGELLPSADVISLVHPESIDDLFYSSRHLTSDAVLDFVKALCEVSTEELESRSSRVYILSKVVEFAHFNMNRVRLVWRRIWSVLSDFFVTVGQHSNLRVAMYAVDSLRQLSIKFLEREELSKYTFQTEFLQPFSTLMSSREYELKELILRCMSQIVASKVSHIRSGWKTIFAVLEEAVHDGNRNLVVLAFETMERIVREHFSIIIENERATFTSCVNCLVVFSKTRCSSDVSLNALAFLRFCALKLAEGLLGDLEEAAKEESQEAEDIEEIIATDPASQNNRGSETWPQQQPSQQQPALRKQGRSSYPTTTFTDSEAHVHFWFPLLEGLAELAFDTRSSIRRSALEVLHDTLKFHGEMFSESFWRKVFDSILFPIFRSVQSETTGNAESKFEKERKQDTSVNYDSEDDAWVQETYVYTLRLVVNLSVQFHHKVSAVWESLLSLLASLMQRQDRRISKASIESAHSLLSGLGATMDEEQWSCATTSLTEALTNSFGAYSRSMQQLAQSQEELESGMPTTMEYMQQCLSYKGSVAELVHVAGDLHTRLRRCMPVGCAETLALNVQSVYHETLEMYEKVEIHKCVSAANEAIDQDSELKGTHAESFTLPVELSAGEGMLRMLGTEESAENNANGQWAQQSRQELSGVLRRFISLHNDKEGGTDAAKRRPIIIAALECVRDMAHSNFKNGLSELFYLLAEVMRCEGMDRYSLSLLSEALTKQVGPIIDSVG